MSTLYGTVVITSIVPTSTDDTYPTHHALYGKGGYRTVETLTDRDNLPADRLEEGCLVFVKSENTIYKRAGTGWDTLVVGGDKTYVHVQTAPNTTWNIAHGLGKFPSVTLRDEVGNPFLADVVYSDLNNLAVYLLQPVSGVAVMN